MKPENSNALKQAGPAGELKPWSRPRIKPLCASLTEGKAVHSIENGGYGPS